MNDGFAKYLDVQDTARVLGVAPTQVRHLARRGVAPPALRTGHQWDRAGIARAAVYLALVELMGGHAETPLQVVTEERERIERALDDLLDAPPYLLVKLGGDRAQAYVTVPLQRVVDALRRLPA
jgi:hypothetical protein